MVTVDPAMETGNPDPSHIEATNPDLLNLLETMSIAEIDELQFGVIGFDGHERVTVYNSCESTHAGLDPERVLGQELFTEVAPCVNNYLVAERYRTDTELDEQLDYVFTLRMRPTPVRLRLLADPHARHRYMIVFNRKTSTSES